MAAPTAEEIPVLEQFRKQISDLELRDDMKTDIALMSWLRARDLDIPKANEMLRASLKWRQEQDLDNVLNFVPPSNYKTDYDYEIVGSDEEGRPICVLPCGTWDIRKAITSGEREIWLRYVDQMFARVFQKMKETSQKLNKEVTQFIFILDYADFSMRQLTSLANVDSMMEVARRFEANYPETMYKSYAVNASRIFTMLFAMLKPLLSERTVSKIQIYSGAAKWKPVLQRELPLNQLPLEFGGTRELGRRVSIGSLPHVDKGLLEGISFVTIKVGAGQKIDLEYKIQNPNTKIMWTFKTDSYDIGFSITRDRKDEIYSYKRCNSHVAQEQDEITCDKPGEYFLTFDNTYSKMTAKTVHYLIEIVDPAADEDDTIIEADE